MATGKAASLERSRTKVLSEDLWKFLDSGVAWLMGSGAPTKKIKIKLKLKEAGNARNNDGAEEDEEKRSRLFTPCLYRELDQEKRNKSEIISDDGG